MSGPRVLHRKGDEVPDRRSPIEPTVLGAITILICRVLVWDKDNPRRPQDRGDG
jgi:hypothetical protein